MLYKKKLLVGLLVIFSSVSNFSYGEDKPWTKDDSLNFAKRCFEEIQNMPLSKEWKYYIKVNEKRFLDFVAHKLDEREEANRLYEKEQKERNKQAEEAQERKSLLERLRLEISTSNKGYAYSSGIHDCESASDSYWIGRRPPRPECNKVAEYYKAYLQYSAAFLIQEKIQSLDKQKTAHPNDSELIDFLQREKSKLEQELQSIFVYDTSKPGQSYYESLSEEKKKDLTGAIEEITKKEKKIDDYSREFLQIHNVFKRK